MARGVTAKRVTQACVHTLRWMVVMLRNGRLPAGIGAVGLAAALAYVVTDAQFAVDRVVITGVAALPGSTVAEATNALGQSVFRVDVNDVARRVAALPAVRHVDVAVQAPDTLVIRLEERQPVIVWETPDQSFLIDESGVVIAAADPAMASALPRLRALAGVPVPIVGGSVDVMPIRATQALNTRLPAETGLTRAVVTLDPAIGLIVQAEQWRALVGTGEQLGRKLAVLNVLVRDQTWTDADVRDPERPVLRKRPDDGRAVPGRRP